MNEKERNTREQTENGDGRKKRWTPPELKELPRLTDLTLQTGSPIPGTGNINGGFGSTVFF